MITFERTTDLHLVKLIVTHPSIWPHLSDDGDNGPENYEAIDNPAIRYVLAKDSDTILGLLIFKAQGSICWEVTIMVVPDGRGRALDIAQEGLKWVFSETKCLRIISRVLKSNRLAIRLNKRAGFKTWGVNRSCVMKNGKLEDYVLFGISKSEFAEEN